MSFEIRILDSLEEKQPVFKLRYEIYCDEVHQSIWRVSAHGIGTVQ
jgi:hypothetical protein